MPAAGGAGRNEARLKMNGEYVMKDGLRKMTKAEQAVVSDIENDVAQCFQVRRYRNNGAIKYALSLEVEAVVDGQWLLTLKQLKMFRDALQDCRIAGWEEGQTLELEIEPAGTELICITHCDRSADSLSAGVS
jgi:hypothetical protein